MTWRRLFGNPQQLLFRGTQHLSPGTQVRGSLSFTPSLPVAVIWSARPGDIWSHRARATFLSTSTVHAAHVHSSNTLKLNEGAELSTKLGDVLRLLQYGEPSGITHDEVLRIFNYMHNRLIGKARGGEFGYTVYDEEGGELDEQDLLLSFSSPRTLISEVKDDFEYDWAERLQTIDRVLADTFVFADAPTVQKVAQRLGYDALTYQDVFQGGESASKELLHRDVVELPGVDEEWDEIEGEYVPSHVTVRPLNAPVQYVWSLPAEALIS